MITNIKTVTYEEIDRILFERIRRELVRIGHLPDVTAFAGNPAGYENAKTVIRNSGKTVIEVFGPGAPDARDEKSFCKIVIDRTRRSRGSWGSAGVPIYTSREIEGRTVIDRSIAPDNNFDLDYQVRLISKRIADDRIMSQVMDNVLPSMGYVPTIQPNGTNSGHKVLVTFSGDLLISDKHFIERMYRYSIEDVWLTKPKTIAEDVPLLQTVTFDIELKGISNLFPSETVILDYK